MRSSTTRRTPDSCQFPTGSATFLRHSHRNGRPRAFDFAMMPIDAVSPPMATTVAVTLSRKSVTGQARAAVQMAPVVVLTNSGGHGVVVADDRIRSLSWVASSM